MSFGLLSTGFVPKTQEDVEQAIRDAIDAAPSLGDNFDTEPESPMGQLVVIPSGAMAEIWAAIEGIARSILNARGVQLDTLVKLYNVSRNPATSSIFAVAPSTGAPNPVVLSGDPGTLIPNGSAFTLDDTGSRFVTSGPHTIGGGGTVDATAIADVTGPVQALADSDWTIATPVTGWDSVSNPSDVTLGQDAETDGKLRSRALRVLTNAGGTASQQIRAAILRLTGVIEVVVIENDSSIQDADGRAPHSFELVVRGGSDQTILDELIKFKPAGIEAVTSVPALFQVSGTVVDSNGDNKTLVFSRPEAVSVWVEIDYTLKQAGRPSTVEDDIQQAILDFGADVSAGDDVVPDDIRGAILCSFDDGNPFLSLVIRMDVFASPTVAADVPTSKTQIADFDSSRITITEVP